MLSLLIISGSYWQQLSQVINGNILSIVMEMHAFHGNDKGTS
jgi:hypothetical protein